MPAFEVQVDSIGSSGGTCRCGVAGCPWAREPRCPPLAWHGGADDDTALREFRDLVQGMGIEEVKVVSEIIAHLQFLREFESAWREEAIVENNGIGWEQVLDSRW